MNLVWVDRDGNTEPLPFDPRDYESPRLSPDGRWIAVEISEGGETQVWILEVERGGSQRLTSLGTDNRVPVWSHDSEWVYYRSGRGQSVAIWKKRFDMSGEAESVLEEDGRILEPYSITRDGSFLLFTQGSEPAGIGRLSLRDDGESESLILTEAPNFDPAVSPDGRFVAFVSRETGNGQIYVREIATEVRHPISNGGGAMPRWSRDGSEIFYYAFGRGFFSVAVTTEPAFDAGAPQELAFGNFFFGGTFDVSLDDQRFLLALRGTRNTATDEATAEDDRIEVVLNWFEELKQLVPTGRRP